MHRDHHTVEPKPTAPATKRAIRIVRCRGTLRVGLVLAVACAAVWSAAPASAITLGDAFDHAYGSPDPTYTARHTPTYDASTHLGTWEQLNNDSRSLASDIATVVEDRQVTAEDRNAHLDVQNCFKAALWDIVFDAGWDDANGYRFDISAELSATTNRTQSCIADRLGIGWATSAPITPSPRRSTTR